METNDFVKSVSHNKPPKTVYIKTHGCQMNEYDSSRMLDLLKSTYEVKTVESPEDADLILMNTCSIREKAKEKVFSELGVYRGLKEKKPDLTIAVGGCVASQEGQYLLERAPYVDIVFGPQTLHRLPELLNTVKTKKKSVVDVSFPEIEKFDKLPPPSVSGPTAFVSIMEGCNKFCTFCIVPYTRGQEISRDFDDVLYEVSELAEKGVKEITLLGQNVNAYRGKMHSPTNEHDLADLALLISYIAEIDGIERIRFTTSHPLEFSSRLIEAYKTVPKLANHLHLPVQSGSNRILGLMKRGHTIESYQEKLRALRAVRPDISITSDFIVGFPGETEEDFQATLDLVANCEFDQSYCFMYSERPGTKAALLKDSVPLEVKKERLHRLQARLTQQTIQFSQRLLGTIQPVLVVGPSEKNPHLLHGRTESNRSVYFENPSQGNNSDRKTPAAIVDSLIGRIIPIEIKEVYTHSLNGIRVV